MPLSQNPKGSRLADSTSRKFIQLDGIPMPLHIIQTQSEYLVAGAIAFYLVVHEEMLIRPWSKASFTSSRRSWMAPLIVQA